MCYRLRSNILTCLFVASNPCCPTWPTFYFVEKLKFVIGDSVRPQRHYYPPSPRRTRHRQQALTRPTYKPLVKVESLVSPARRQRKIHIRLTSAQRHFSPPRPVSVLLCKMLAFLLHVGRSRDRSSARRPGVLRFMF